MTTDYRSLCAIAIELWDADCDMESVISQMRTALAQPEPAAPTDEELMAAAKAAVNTYPRVSELPYFMDPDSTEYEPMLLALRAVARWGTPPPPAT